MNKKLRQLKKRSITGSAAFVIVRAAGCGVPRISPVMALAWMNLLYTPEGINREIYTLKQAVAAFRYLGRAGVIRKVERWNFVWLDTWEIVES